jgi:hypothetical protein
MKNTKARRGDRKRGKRKRTVVTYDESALTFVIDLVKGVRESVGHLIGKRMGKKEVGDLMNIAEINALERIRMAHSGKAVKVGNFSWQLIQAVACWEAVRRDELGKSRALMDG